MTSAANTHIAESRAELQQAYEDAYKEWRVASLAADAALNRYHAAFTAVIERKVRIALNDGDD